MNKKPPEGTGGRDQMRSDNLIAAQRYRWRHYADFSRPLESHGVTRALIHLTPNQTWTKADYEGAARLLEHHNPIGCLRMAQLARRSFR